jgi:Tol biopolymer transport system component
MTPPAFDRVVQTCLAKDAEDRWQTAHDVKLQLEWIAEGGSVVGLPAPVAARRKSRERLAWAMAGVAALATAVFAVGFLSRAPQPLKQSRFEIPPPPGLTQVGSPRISPDGRHIAFIAVDGEGNSQIWLRPLDSIEARPLAGTEGAGDTRPIWSPDSRHIAFFVANKLKKVPVSGGPAQTISDVNGADGSWSNKGEIVFDGGPGDPLRRVSASGGVAKAEITLEERKDVTGLGWPEFLPDGRRFLYISDTLGDSSMITLHTLGEDEDVPLAPADSRVQYVEPGYLIYVIDGMLVAHPFDSGGGKLTGEPIPLADNVGATTVGLADFSASAEGTLVFRSGESGGRRLLWFDRDGRELGALAEGADFADSWFSPDGKKVVTAIRDNESANMDLWIHDLDRDVMSRFTFDPGVDQNPLWSPDGSKIVFSSNRSESQGLYLKDASGVGAVEPLLEAEENMYPGDWSRDGRVLLFGKVVSETSWDIWALPTDGSGDSFALVQSEFVEVRPTFSPDGKWFAYQSNESGREEIYVRQFPGPGGQWQVSTNGGVEPIWSADGSEIFYLDGSRDLVSVPVTMGATFEAGLPQKLFDPEVFGTIQRSRFAVTRDGQRFLVLTSMSGEAIRPATVVLNWHAGLEN